MARKKKTLTTEEINQRRQKHNNNMKSRYADGKKKKNELYMKFARESIFKDEGIDFSGIDASTNSNSKVKAMLFDMMMAHLSRTPADHFKEATEIKKKDEAFACNAVLEPALACDALPPILI